MSPSPLRLTTVAVVLLSISVRAFQHALPSKRHTMASPSLAVSPTVQRTILSRSYKSLNPRDRDHHWSYCNSALFATNTRQSTSEGDNNIADAVAPLSLRAIAIALCVTTFDTLIEQPAYISAVRLSTAAITLVDFAPAAGKQWRNTTLALGSSSDSPRVRRFWNLVRFKTMGEMLGLGIMLASAELSCLGAAVALLSHVLFWIGGGGTSQVDASGNEKPVPPALVKSIFAADMTLFCALVAGAVASPPRLRAGAAYTYSAIVFALCVEKLKVVFPKRRKRQATTKENITESDVSDDKESSSPIEENHNNSTVPWNFSWHNQWYPMAFSKVTSKDTPHRLELFGEHLVLWHNGTEWAALADECPHRLAPLSEGRIDEEGQIECPYHGWTFSGQGACTKIPQAATNNTASFGACSARSHVVVEKQGIIWVWGRVGASKEEADESLVPVCPAIDDDRFVWIDFSRDLPYSADVLLENVLDPSHVPFTHHKTISRRDTAKPLPLTLTSPITAKGFEGEMKSDVPIGKMGEENAKQGLVTERTTGFAAPTYMHNTIRSANVKDMDYDKGRESWTVVYATPTGPGRSRMLARFPFRFPPSKRRFGLNIPVLIFKYLPDWINHMGQLRVTDDDNIFLPLQERRTHDIGGWTKYKMPTNADTFVKGFRRWLDKAGPPPHSPFAFDELRILSPSRELLLDRKSQHTNHCSSCRGALKNSGRVRVAMRALLIACTAVAPTLVFQKAYKSLVAVAVAAGVFAQIRKAAVYVENALTTGLVDYPPPRNRPEMVGRAQELRTVEEGRKL